MIQVSTKDPDFGVLTEETRHKLVWRSLFYKHLSEWKHMDDLRPLLKTSHLEEAPPSPAQEHVQESTSTPTKEGEQETTILITRSSIDAELEAYKAHQKSINDDCTRDQQLMWLYHRLLGIATHIDGLSLAQKKHEAEQANLTVYQIAKRMIAPEDMHLLRRVEDGDGRGLCKAFRDASILLHHYQSGANGTPCHKSIAELAKEECWNHVRGTCGHGNRCLRQHIGIAGRDPSYKKRNRKRHQDMNVCRRKTCGTRGRLHRPRRTCSWGDSGYVFPEFDPPNAWDMAVEGQAYIIVDQESVGSARDNGNGDNNVCSETSQSTTDVSTVFNMEDAYISQGYDHDSMWDAEASAESEKREIPPPELSPSGARIYGGNSQYFSRSSPVITMQAPSTGLQQHDVHRYNHNLMVLHEILSNHESTTEGKAMSIMNLLFGHAPTDWGHSQQAMNREQDEITDALLFEHDINQEKVGMNRDCTTQPVEMALTCASEESFLSSVELELLVHHGEVADTSNAYHDGQDVTYAHMESDGRPSDMENDAPDPGDGTTLTVLATPSSSPSSSSSLTQSQHSQQLQQQTLACTSPASSASSSSIGSPAFLPTPSTPSTSAMPPATITGVDTNGTDTTATSSASATPPATPPSAPRRMQDVGRPSSGGDDLGDDLMNDLQQGNTKKGPKAMRRLILPICEESTQTSPRGVLPCPQCNHLVLSENLHPEVLRFLRKGWTPTKDDIQALHSNGLCKIHPSKYYDLMRSWPEDNPTIAIGEQKKEVIKGMWLLLMGNKSAPFDTSINENSSLSDIMGLLDTSISECLKDEAWTNIFPRNQRYELLQSIQEVKMHFYVMQQMIDRLGFNPTIGRMLENQDNLSSYGHTSHGCPLLVKGANFIEYTEEKEKQTRAPIDEGLSCSSGRSSPSSSTSGGKLSSFTDISSEGEPYNKHVRFPYIDFSPVKKKGSPSKAKVSAVTIEEEPNVLDKFLEFASRGTDESKDNVDESKPIEHHDDTDETWPVAKDPSFDVYFEYHNQDYQHNFEAPFNWEDEVSDEESMEAYRQLPQSTRTTDVLRETMGIQMDFDDLNPWYDDNAMPDVDLNDGIQLNAHDQELKEMEEQEAKAPQLNIDAEVAAGLCHGDYRSYVAGKTDLKIEASAVAESMKLQEKGINAPEDEAFKACRNMMGQAIDNCDKYSNAS